jgi:circadian clock protein KaiC
VLPITSLRLDHKASRQRVSTGILALDEMLGGKGVYRGSSVLVSGSPGTGKSSIAASFLHAACERGERALFFAYEESAEQIYRNMRSIGIDLSRWQDSGLLHIHASRPTLFGLEQHLVLMHDLVRDVRPSVVVVDPISNLTMERHDTAVKAALMRLIDFLKQEGATALFTSLTTETSAHLGESEVGVSSLMDCWLVLNNAQANGERTRTIQVLKSRGMAHSNQVREFVLGNQGIDLVDVYRTDSSEVLVGSARASRLALDRIGIGVASRARTPLPRGRRASKGTR